MNPETNNIKAHTTISNTNFSNPKHRIIITQYKSTLYLLKLISCSTYIHDIDEFLPPAFIKESDCIVYQSILSGYFFVCVILIELHLVLVPHSNRPPFYPAFVQTISWSVYITLVGRGHMLKVSRPNCPPVYFERVIAPSQIYIHSYIIVCKLDFLKLSPTAGLCHCCGCWKRLSFGKREF